MPHAFKGAAQLGRYRRVELGETFMAHRPRYAARGSLAADGPASQTHSIDDPAFWVNGAVPRIKAQISSVMTQFVAKMGIIPVDIAPSSRA